MQKFHKSETIISLVDVDKEFGDKKVLNQINLDIKKGDFVTLLDYQDLEKLQFCA